jgi:hypothetical protein
MYPIQPEFQNKQHLTKDQAAATANHKTDTFKR